MIQITGRCQIELWKAEDVGIAQVTSSANSYSFSGTITGESTALSIDLGVARKSVTVSGIITDQIIKKNIDGTEVIVNLTAMRLHN